MANSSTPTSRRRILQVLFGGSVAALAGVAGFVTSKFLAPIAGEVLSMVAGRVSDFAMSPTKLVKLGTKDVMLIHSADSFTALDLKCSHAGCTVHWFEDQQKFKCPCHGGQYSMDGKVIHGPPPRPLSKLRVTITNGEITVTDMPA